MGFWRSPPGAWRYTANQGGVLAFIGFWSASQWQRSSRAPDKVVFLRRKLPLGWPPAGSSDSWYCCLSSTASFCSWTRATVPPFRVRVRRPGNPCGPHIPANAAGARPVRRSRRQTMSGPDDRTESLLYVGGPRCPGCWRFWGLWHGYLWRRRKPVLPRNPVFFSLLYMLGRPDRRAYRLFYEVIPGVALFQRPLDGGFSAQYRLGGPGRPWCWTKSWEEIRGSFRPAGCESQGRVLPGAPGHGILICPYGRGVTLHQDWAADDPGLRSPPSAWIFASRVGSVSATALRTVCDGRCPLAPHGPSGGQPWDG